MQQAQEEADPDTEIRCHSRPQLSKKPFHGHILEGRAVSEVTL